jgi:hypothetical protein
VDVLRRAAGARRPRRYWDRGMWFCGVAMAVLFGGVGVYSWVMVSSGQRVEGTVVSCTTDLHLEGRVSREQSRCDFIVPGQPGTVPVDTSQEYEAGTKVELVVRGSGVDEVALDKDQRALVPVAAVILLVTWWIGWPPRGPRRKRKFKPQPAEAQSVVIHRRHAK